MQMTRQPHPNYINQSARFGVMESLSNISRRKATTEKIVHKFINRWGKQDR